MEEIVTTTEKHVLTMNPDEMKAALDIPLSAVLLIVTQTSSGFRVEYHLVTP